MEKTFICVKNHEIILKTDKLIYINNNNIRKIVMKKRYVAFIESNDNEFTIRLYTSSKYATEEFERIENNLKTHYRCVEMEVEKSTIALADILEDLANELKYRGKIGF